VIVSFGIPLRESFPLGFFSSQTTVDEPSGEEISSRFLSFHIPKFFVVSLSSFSGYKRRQLLSLLQRFRVSLRQHRETRRSSTLPES